MGLFGGDSKSTKNETNKQQSAGFSEIEGPVNALQLDGSSASGKYAKTNTTLNFTVADHGSIDKAFGLGNNALDSVEVVAGKAISESGAARRDALNFGQTALTRVLSFANTANSKAQNTLEDANRNFTNKFSEFATRQSSSSDQRVTDIAKWGVGAVVALMAFNAWSRRKA